MSPIAIVTASDSGIGQESAKELAENGFDILLPYYKQARAPLPRPANQRRTTKGTGRTNSGGQKDRTRDS